MYGSNQFSGSKRVNFVVESLALVETWPDTKFHELRDFNDKKKKNVDKLGKLLFVIIMEKSDIFAHYLVYSFVLTCIVLQND